MNPSNVITTFICELSFEKNLTFDWIGERNSHSAFLFWKKLNLVSKVPWKTSLWSFFTVWSSPPNIHRSQHDSFMSAGMFLVDYEQPLCRLIRRACAKNGREVKKVARNLWARSTLKSRASHSHTATAIFISLFSRHAGWTKRRTGCP